MTLLSMHSFVSTLCPGGSSMMYCAATIDPCSLSLDL
jgi:hypothetical protein